MSNKPIGATKVFSNPMMMYARRHSTSGSQSLISCKKHRQSLIQSLISVSARGDHVGANDSSLSLWTSQGGVGVGMLSSFDAKGEFLPSGLLRV